MPAATSNFIHVLLADSSPLQLQLLTAALRRHPEFRLRSCVLDGEALLGMLSQAPTDVAVLALTRQNGSACDFGLLRRLHLAHPQVAKVLLLETCDRELAVGAFRAGARGLFCFGESPFRALCQC